MKQGIELITDIAISFQRSRVLLTAYQLGIFTALGEKKKLSVEVAKAVKADPRATDRLMNALCAIGLLRKENNYFSNTPLSSRFLVKGKREFMSGLMHSVYLWDSWGTLTEAVQRGRSAGEGIPEDSDWLEAFIEAMHWRASGHAKDVVKLIDLTGVSRLLDIGGGSGAYSMAFVRAKNGLKATVFDLPSVIPLTKKYLKREGLMDKIDFIEGDYNVNKFGSGYDLVFLSAIIHINSPEQNKELIKKSADALNPKGQIVIQDFIMDEGRTRPEFGAIFALNMLVNTEAGDTYTGKEVSSWMKEAGLSNIARKDTNLDTSLIIGCKIH